MTLINSVLTSIPIYFFLSFFRVPKLVVNKIIRLQRNFLWGGSSDQTKIPWIRWETMCLPKEHGWLGVKDIPSFNVSLLGKWKWDLLLNQGEIWARVLEAKYGGWRSLDGPSRVSSESLWWRDLKSIYHHPQLGQQLNKSILWKVGCGDKCKFWEDKWSGGENNSAVKFPRLYTISAQLQHLIQQVGAFNEGGWEWNFQWRRIRFRVWVGVWR